MALEGQPKPRITLDLLDRASRRLDSVRSSPSQYPPTLVDQITYGESLLSHQRARILSGDTEDGGFSKIQAEKGVAALTALLPLTDQSGHENPILVRARNQVFYAQIRPSLAPETESLLQTQPFTKARLKNAFGTGMVISSGVLSAGVFIGGIYFSKDHPESIIIATMIMPGLLGVAVSGSLLVDSINEPVKRNGQPKPL